MKEIIAIKEAWAYRGLNQWRASTTTHTHGSISPTQHTALCELKMTVPVNDSCHPEDQVAVYVVHHSAALCAAAAGVGGLNFPVELFVQLPASVDLK